MNSVEVDELIAIADQADDSGDFDKSLQCWRRIVELQPTSIAYCRLGRAATEAGQWSEAQLALEKSLAINPLRELQLVCMGSLFARRTDVEDDTSFRQAVQCFRDAIAIEEKPSTWTMLGSVLRQLGNMDEARKSYIHALSLDPLYEEALCNLAVMERHADSKHAESLFLKALEIDPDYFWAHQEYGKLLSEENRYPHAIVHFEKCVKLNPSDHWSHLYLANAFAMSDNLEMAEDFYQRAITLDQAGKEFYANFLESQGRLMEAEALRQ